MWKNHIIWLTLLATLAGNGSKDNIVFDKVYKVLTKFPCLLFNLEFIVYKQVNFSTLDAHKLLIKARE